MKLNKSMQYGLLLALYLSRSGLASLTDIAENLKLSKSFLEQIANKLKKYNVVQSTRGIHGGYELVGEPTVKELFDALGITQTIPTKDLDSYKTGHQEHRALAQYSLDISSALNSLFKRKIRNISLQSVANEVAMLNKINTPSKAIN